MSSPIDPVATGANGGDVVHRSVAQTPVAVLNCSRIGRVANPPGFSITDWFWSSFRR
ncbi:hypothetical protein [Mycolicibacterium parafortuitum]|uniref:hypothetical protein n=1 Tax=Mycolicibacterium parafortuitum TaxID=39692 RepID=UPI00191C04BC